MPRQALVRKTIDTASGAVIWSNAKTGDEIDRQSLQDLSEEMKTRLALHGLSQRGGDSYASASNISEVQEALSKTLTSIRAGTWSNARSAGGSAVPLIVRALAKALGIEESKAQEIYAEMPTGEQRILRKIPEIAAVLEELRPPKAKPSKDVPSLLALQQKLAG